MLEILIANNLLQKACDIFADRVGRIDKETSRNFFRFAMKKTHTHKYLTHFYRIQTQHTYPFQRTTTKKFLFRSIEFKNKLNKCSFAYKSFAIQISTFIHCRQCLAGAYSVNVSGTNRKKRYFASRLSCP